jgi:hypothetical protein
MRSENPYRKDAARQTIMHHLDENLIIVWNWDTSDWDNFTKVPSRSAHPLQHHREGQS